jgi:hypothetical protein
MIEDLEKQFDNDNFKEKKYNNFLFDLLYSKAKKYFKENSCDLISEYENELKEKIYELICSIK